VGVVVDSGEAFGKNDVGAYASVEIVVGEGLQDHAEAVAEEGGVPKGFDAQLEVGHRTPGKGLLREEEPDKEGDDESDCVSHEEFPREETTFYLSKKPGDGSVCFASNPIEVKISRKIPKEYSIFDIKHSIKVRNFSAKA
jgi:hypothetical protein